MVLESETKEDDVSLTYGSDCTRCQSCIKMFMEMDEKYTLGRNTRPTTAKSEEEADDQALVQKSENSESIPVPKKRVRKPKLLDYDYVDPERHIKPKRDALSPIKEDKENDEALDIKSEKDLEDSTLILDDGEDLDDEDYTAPRRTGRKWKMNDKYVSVMRSGKRGRPPVIMDKPVACKTCGQKFTILKEYKEHCVSESSFNY